MEPIGRDETFRETDELSIILVGQKSNRPSWGEMSSASDELKTPPAGHWKGTGRDDPRNLQLQEGPSHVHCLADTSNSGFLPT